MYRISSAAVCLLVTLRNIQSAYGALAVLPWEAPQYKQLPWQDLDNDLPGLLRVQSVNNSIALLLLDDKSTELALNTVTSLVLYGNAPNYIVAATSAAGTSACKNLRLPCYNATGLADNMDWGKIVMAAEVFKLGYDLLFTDADVVYIKDAFGAYNMLIDSKDADGSFMCELKRRHHNGVVTKRQVSINSGNFLLRNNARTRALMDAWLRGAKSGHNGSEQYLNLLVSLHSKSGNRTVGICSTKSEYSMLKSNNMAAIKCHPVNLEPGTEHLGKEDQLAAMRSRLCSDRRVYLHAIGQDVSNSMQHKKEWLQELGIWMTDIQPRSHRVVTTRPVGVLPCPSHHAWILDYHQMLPFDPSTVIRQ